MVGMSSHSFLRRRAPGNRSGGFTLVELLVTIGIVMAVMGVVFLKNGAFSGAVGLRNQAFEVAFALREAQLLAVSANETAPNQLQRYGVHFTSGTRAFTIFQDTNNDNFYTTSDTVVRTVRVGEDYEMGRLLNASGSVTDNDTEYAILFQKPNFDARFILDAGSAAITGPVYVEVRKTGTTGTGVEDVRWVEVTGPGQISVETAS